MLRRFTISSRMLFLVGFLALFSLGISVAFSYFMQSVEHASLSETKMHMTKGYERSLRMAVESFATQLSAIHSQALEKGDDAELAVRLGIRHARFEGNHYFFIYDMKGKTIALPVSPSLYGKDRYDFKDKRGLLVVQEMIKAVQNGGGYVTYWYPKPGEKEASPKLSYVKPIDGTNLFIGTGVYVDDIDAELARFNNTLNAILSKAQYTVGISIAIVFIFLVLPLSLALIRSILTPLRLVTQNAQQVAKGNLDIRIDVKGHDEITHLESALDLMIHTLNDNIKEIEAKSEAAEQKAREAEKATETAVEAQSQTERAKREGMHAAAARLESVVERVSTVSEEISIKTEEIRSGAEIQSQRISETATAMEEMNSTVLEVARNSSEAAREGANSQTQAQSGSDIVQHSIQALSVAQQKILNLKENMMNLGSQAESIGNIMTVIEDIADQTNLLALNAAIEAARAGEAGRGFAVVADEVRKLAEKTMGATKEVGDSIRAIQANTRSNIENVEVTAHDMDSVVELSTKSGSMLVEIVQGVESSSNQIQEIATAAEEQSATSEEINRSIYEINRITQETSQGVTMTATAISELTEQIAELRNIVQELKRA